MAAGRAHTIFGRQIAGTKMPNKALGQHWLKDRLILEAIIDSADITKKDTVLEIGPGLGTMTSVILSRAKNVIAVEYDQELAQKLPGQFPGTSLDVVHQDILSFDLTQLPADFKVVANIPYYITNKIVRALTETDNRPSTAVLLVQKEVAERIAASSGSMSILSVMTQIWYEASLGPEVKREYFTPPPKVDSQVVILKRRDGSQISDELQPEFLRLIKAGFAERRKKLRSSLAGGLAIDKQAVEQALTKAGISLDARAQELSIQDWKKLTTLL